jgi:hypothetical protein
MPTTAKLVAAVCMAIIGFLGATAYAPQLPEGTNTTYLPGMMAGLGFVVGWLALGPHMKKGYPSAISLGLRASAFLAFWGLLLFGIYHMVKGSFKVGHYHDLGEALLDVPQQMIFFGKLMWYAPLIEIMVVGGILAGLVTEFVAKRWR